MIFGKYEKGVLYKCAFTLAEMLVVMLILTIVLAAFAPLMTKRKTVDMSSPWRYAANNSDIYYGLADSQTAMIGTKDKANTDNAKLIINAKDDNQRHISFKTSGTQVADLRLSEANFLLGSEFGAMTGSGKTARGTGV